MIVTSATLNGLRTSFSAKFQGAIKLTQPTHQRIATEVPSTSKSNTYGWLGQSSEFREWVGARQFNSIQEHGYTINNKTFENSVEVDREDIEDDNLGIYTPMVQNLAQKGVLFPDKLCYDLLNAGETTLCYDGQNFFDTEHPVNTKNDGTGSDELVSNIIEEEGYAGEPWYLLDTSQVIKPLIFQSRRPLNLITKFNPDDPAAFTNNVFQFGADLRCNVGFGMWQMAIKVKAEPTLANLWKAKQRLESFKFDGGEPCELQGTLIVHGTGTEGALTKLMTREQISEGGVTVSNEMKGKFELLKSQRIS